MNTEMISMVEYIKKFHSGNKAAFCREFGRLPQSMTKMDKNAAQWSIVIYGDIKYLVQIRVAVPL